MVKLVRLTTQDPNCVFDTKFNQDIKIKKDSKVCLQNFCCQINPTGFDINSANNRIDYQTSTGNIKQAHLTTASYNKDNYDALFEDMRVQLNKQLTLTNQAEFGFSWNVGLSNQKIKFDYQIGSNGPNLNSQNLENITRTTSAGDYFYRRTNGRADNKSFLYINNPISQGCGVCRIRQDSLITTPTPNPTDNFGYMIGLTTQKIDTSTTEIDVSQINHGLRLRTNDAGSNPVYEYIYNGGAFSTALTPSTNTGTQGDTVDIAINNGKVEYYVYKHTGASYDNGTLLYSTPYNGKDDLYPVIVLYGDQATDGLRLRTFLFSPNPFYNNTQSENHDVVDLGTIPSPRNTPRPKYFQIIDSELSQFLGFKENRIPYPAGTINEYTVSYTGDDQFEPSDISESYVVEFMGSLDCDSYDSQDGNRRSIIHTIVNSEREKDRVFYNSPYPLYISLNNANDMNIRNLKLRVLKEDLSPIEVSGLSMITLLFD